MSPYLNRAWMLFSGYNLGKEYVGILRLHNAIEGRDKLAQVIYEVHHHGIFVSFIWDNVIKIVLSKIYGIRSTKNFQCYSLFKAEHPSNLLKVFSTNFYCFHSRWNKYEWNTDCVTPRTTWTRFIGYSSRPIHPITFTA